MAVAALSSFPLEVYSATQAIPDPGRRAVGSSNSNAGAEVALDRVEAARTEVDPLPGMLLTAYRAPLASALFPLAGLRGEPVAGERGALEVDAATAIAPMKEQPDPHSFNPNAPARHPASLEALTAYRTQVGPTVEGMGLPPLTPQPRLNVLV